MSHSGTLVGISKFCVLCRSEMARGECLSWCCECVQYDAVRGGEMVVSGGGYAGVTVEPQICAGLCKSHHFSFLRGFHISKFLQY